MPGAVLIPLAAGALLVFLIVLFAQRGRGELDLSPQTLFRVYLYVGSFAGVLMLVFGLAALLNAGLAAAAGNEFVYGSTPDVAYLVRPCPPDATCPPAPEAEEFRAQQTAELVRRRADDIVRGASFTAFALPFWLAHWLARNRIGFGDQGLLQRAYLLVGTAVFGIGTIALLPMGVYQALSGLVISRPPEFYRQGVSDTLTAGIVSLGVWLLYLRLAAEGLRGGGRRFVAGQGGPPPEPAPVGARIGPGPGERSAGAEAALPEERF
jgi:hypothetical protein